MPRVSSSRVGLHLEGVYQRLLEYERRKCSEPDPRRLGGSGEDDSVFRRPTHRLDALEAGEPVRFPVWILGGATVPDERIRRVKREDRSINGWLVAADDSVAPLREGER
jgi:hypothetical protein